MKNNETLWDVLFTEASHKKTVSANILVSAGVPNPFHTGQWVCPNCGHRFIKDVVKNTTTDNCPSCDIMIEFNLANLYQESELREYWRQYISTPNEFRRRYLYD